MPLIAALVSFVVYLRTMAPTVYGLDSAELTTGAYVLGIVHAPGSPLYLLLGHLFTWLPFGDVGYRVNLLSAVAAAGAVGFVCAIQLRLVGRPLIALAASWFLAFSYYFWVSAVAAELYALHACFVAGLIWLALRWRESERPWQLCVFTLLFGLGLGNHLSLSVLMPGLAWLVAGGRQGLWRRPRLLAAAAICGVIGASVYLYLPLRAGATPMNYAGEFGVDVRTWHGFWWMVTGRMFAREFLAVSASELPAQVGLYAYRLWSNFFGIGCLFGVAGLALDFKRRRAEHTALLLMLVGHLGFILTYGVSDKELMLTPTYLVWSLWAGLGMEAFCRRLADRGLAVVGGASVGLMVVAMLAVNFGYADISRDRSARERAEAILDAMPEGAVFVGRWAEAPVLEYMQLVEGRRRDVHVVNRFFLKARRKAALLADTRLADRPWFASAENLLGEKGMTYQHEKECDCYRVLRARSAIVSQAKR